MPEPQFIQLPFGPGLDKETGVMVVRPNSMQDLRNVYHHEGSLVVRAGVEKTVDFVDYTTPSTYATHVLAGIAIRSERIGIVVTFEQVTRRVTVHRVDALGQTATPIGHWYWRFPASWDGTPWTGTVAWPGSDIPKVVLAEIYGQVYMAHDTAWAAARADTCVYDPYFDWSQLPTDDDGNQSEQPVGWTPGAQLWVLEADLDTAFRTPDLDRIRFRGVVRHLEYLFGWGWGNGTEDRPEILRVSMPGQPRTFRKEHYFLAGDRRDPIIAAEPARQTLLVCKETETYQVIGYSRGTFGIRPYDQLYGALASRLITSVSGTVFVWSAEGPMMGTDTGPFEKVWLPLDLGGFEPATLVERIDFDEGWADYIDEVELVIFCFGRRAYILSLRNPADPRWTYWELARKAYTGFRLYGDEGDVGAVPTGAPTVNSMTVDYEQGCDWPRLTVTVNNSGQGPVDLVELWLRPNDLSFDADVLTDKFLVDTNGDGVPDNWTKDELETGNASSYVDTSAPFITIGLIRGNTNDYAEVYWDWPGTPTGGDVYRFTCRIQAAGRAFDDEIQIGVRSLDGVDATLLETQTTWVDDEMYLLFNDHTAHASIVKLRVFCRVKVTGVQRSLGDVVARFQDPRLYEEHAVAAEDWYAAVRNELVSPESLQILPAVPLTEPGANYDVAVRYVNRAGEAPSGWDDANPSNWDAGSVTTVVADLDEPGWVVSPGTPGFLPLFGFSDVVGRFYTLMQFTCRDDPLLPGEHPSTLLLRRPYRNRVIQVLEDGTELLRLAPNVARFKRFWLDSEIGGQFVYRGRYSNIGNPSELGPTLLVTASATGADEDPPTFTLSQGLTRRASYTIDIQLANPHPDVDFDGIPDTEFYTSVEIWDNYDNNGGLLPAGQWYLRFWSQALVIVGIPVYYQFPPDDQIYLGRDAANLTVTVRVREVFDPYGTVGWDNQGRGSWEARRRLWGPWSEEQSIQIT